MNPEKDLQPGGEDIEEAPGLDGGGLGGEDPVAGRGPTAPGGMPGGRLAEGADSNEGGPGADGPGLDRDRREGAWSESRDMEDEIARRRPA